jgi:hypothetical protein
VSAAEPQPGVGTLAEGLKQPVSSETPPEQSFGASTVNDLSHSHVAEQTTQAPQLVDHRDRGPHSPTCGEHVASRRWTGSAERRSHRAR